MVISSPAPQALRILMYSYSQSQTIQQPPTKILSTSVLVGKTPLPQLPLLQPKTILRHQRHPTLRGSPSLLEPQALGSCFCSSASSSVSGGLALENRQWVVSWALVDKAIRHCASQHPVLLSTQTQIPPLAILGANIIKAHLIITTLPLNPTTSRNTKPLGIIATNISHIHALLTNAIITNSAFLSFNLPENLPFPYGCRASATYYPHVYIPTGQLHLIHYGIHMATNCKPPLPYTESFHMNWWDLVL